MANSRIEATLGVVGLEKAIAKMENFLLEFRASRASPLMTFPTFDGSGALAWLARANQYFLVNKTPLDRRVDVAMLAIDGPAKPWKQLLVHRCPSLSWDRFVHELLKHFGDSDAGDPKFVAMQQEIPAIITSTNHPDLDTTENSSAPLPLQVQIPIPPPVSMNLPPPTGLPTPATVSAPPLSSSSDILQFQPPFLPLLQRLVPAAAADHAKLMVSFTPPTTTMVPAPLLSASPDILQIQSSFSSLLRCLVPAVHQSTPMVVSFPGSLFSSAGAPFSYLVMLLFLHILGHLLWFDALATYRKHEFEPPPDKVLCFDFDLSLEGKAVLRARQLIRRGEYTSTQIEK